MSEISIRKSGRVGRITLTRPEALNALTADMVEAIATALPDFASDDEITMLVIDGEGEKAFCAGGDIADIYQAMVDQDYDLPRQFWRTEYAMNAALFNLSLIHI